MLIPAWSLGASALALVNVAWLYYLWLIPKERVPKRPLGFVAAMAFGSGIAGTSLLAAYQNDQPLGPLLWALAILTVFLAGFFVYLLRQAPLPDGELDLAVGDMLLPFGAIDSAGTRFHSDELRRKRVLVKFFRGHW